MKFFTYISSLFFSMVLGLNVFANQEQTSLVAQDSLATNDVFQRDTLIDLNKQLRGVKEVTFPKGTIVPEALEITPTGIIILKSSALLKADKYAFELKAVSNSNEVYIVEVAVQQENGKYLVTTICDKIDMATGFRAEGKIYIVVTVSMILFTVIIVYLVLMDRKMRKLNARLENRNS